jgi:hypothetical protein
MLSCCFCSSRGQPLNIRDETTTLDNDALGLPPSMERAPGTPLDRLLGDAANAAVAAEHLPAWRAQELAYRGELARGRAAREAALSSDFFLHVYHNHFATRDAIEARKGRKSLAHPSPRDGTFVVGLFFHAEPRPPRARLTTRSKCGRRGRVRAPSGTWRVAPSRRRERNERRLCAVSSRDRLSSSAT